MRDSAQAMDAEYQSAELLQALFARTATPMLLVNDERLYAACRLLRCTREALLRMSIDDLAAQSPETVTALWNAFLESGTQSGRFAIRRLDGSEVEVNYSATADVIPGVHLSVLAPAMMRTNWIRSPQLTRIRYLRQL